MSGVTILCHHLLIIINITNSNKSVDSTSVRWNLHHPYDRALALEEGKVKTLDLVSTAEARATILEARLAGQKCNKVQKWIQNSTHSLIVIAHHPFLPIIISFFMRTKSNDQVHVKKITAHKNTLGPLLPSQTTLSWAPTACAQRVKPAGGGFVITINSTTIIIYIWSFCSWLSSIHQINEL